MDQDDSMLTSPSSPGDETYDDDNLFPAEETGDIATTVLGRPRTPQNDHLNAAAPGELSPPRDEFTTAGGAGTGSTTTTTARQQIMMMEDEDLSPTAANRTVVSMADEEWRPGQAWRTKKAQEDMQRAWDAVVDKEFSLKEFGDVLAHRLSK